MLTFNFNMMRELKGCCKTSLEDLIHLRGGIVCSGAQQSWSSRVIDSSTQTGKTRSVILTKVLNC